jgi:L-fucose isomerase
MPAPQTVKVALATLGDTRDDFYARRAPLVVTEQQKLDWLRGEFNLLESPVIRSAAAAADFAEQARIFGARALIVHLAIWADPVLTIKMHNYLPLPTLLLGNLSPETSSMVGILGAGGALDQIGVAHTRVLGFETEEARRPVLAFVRAAGAQAALRGQTLGLFGGRSLGIFTATADPAQWQRLFGVDIQHYDQSEIVERAESLSPVTVDGETQWLTGRVGEVVHDDRFTPTRLQKQVASYVATRQLINERGLDFVGVKCQPELSDGYVCQCMAHMLINGAVDSAGEKSPLVHACESDADGALSMQILHLLTGGKPAALLDVRWLNPANGLWTLANCGAMPSSFYATPDAPDGLRNVRLMPHVFGLGGGGAASAVVAPQTVTLARLCRRNGEYWMAIVAGRTVQGTREDLARTTAAFPQAFVETSAGMDFVQQFGSNHLHMVAGDYVDELVAFCKLIGIPWQLWGRKDEAQHAE